MQCFQTAISHRVIHNVRMRIENIHEILVYNEPETIASAFLIRPSVGVKVGILKHLGHHDGAPVDRVNCLFDLLSRKRRLIQDLRTL